MNRTYEEWLKYYENATKEQVIEDTMHDMEEIERLNNIIEELEKWINKNKQWQVISERCIVWEDKLLDKLKELKEGNK